MEMDRLASPAGLVHHAIPGKKETYVAEYDCVSIDIETLGSTCFSDSPQKIGRFEKCCKEFLVI